MEDGELVPHVQRIKRANGRVDLYFRKGGWREGPLKSADGTPELKAEVDAILAKLKLAGEAAAKPKANTVGGTLTLYNRSPEFLCLAASTKYQLQYLIDELIEDCGSTLLNKVDRAWVLEMRAVWAGRGHRAANNRLQVLKNALAPIIDDERDNRIDGDPFNKVKKVPRPHDQGEAHPIWTPAEVKAAIDGAIEREHPGLARAIALARYGGFRLGTVCAVPRHARLIAPNRQGVPERRLYWITEKRKVLCDKREDSRLTEILDRTPNRALTIAYNGNGDKWKERQLDQAFNRLMTALAKKGLVRSAVKANGKTYCPLTMHGLRHTRGVELAKAGASDSVIMAQLEHATSRAAAEYRRQAERSELADLGQDMVDNVVEMEAARATAKTASEQSL